LVLFTKRLLAAGKFLVGATKILFVVPNFVAVTKPFFPCGKILFIYFFGLYLSQGHEKRSSTKIRPNLTQTKPRVNRTKTSHLVGEQTLPKLETPKLSLTKP